ncbi:MAG: hypothetical protein F6K24_10525 [Okeania sp. SIO2D1]|uniref:hypothetical protein n=1 Tax=Okeania sp. SIO2C9 TaxID=2607791 RepID=UPI0013BE5294|nr:hypothetical protein [Okeania sp. SIO2C9]NEQ78164.1 hypothetical protein [Okeania sp. SIO2C9]NES65656.1 hypothetical protein [Okeania sp. SIO2D1]
MSNRAATFFVQGKLFYTKRDRCLLQMVGTLHATSLQKKEEVGNFEKKGKTIEINI